MSASDQEIAAALSAFRRREPEALTQITSLLDAGTIQPHLIIAEAELLLEQGADDPLVRMSRIVSANAGWVEGHSQLATLRFELGEPDCTRSFRDALAGNPANAGLWNAYIAALVDAGDLVGAADAAKNARKHFDVPVLRLIEANHVSTAGQIERAEQIFQELDQDLPELGVSLARHRIRTGDLAAAQALLEKAIAKQPDDLSIWALIELLWRTHGDPRAEWLSTDPRFCCSKELEYSATELDQLAHFIRGLHSAPGAPMGQSARGGSQTRGALFDRAAPEIEKLKARLQRAVDQYIDALPPRDPKHPLLKHKGGRILAAGGWSIRLQGAGFHVPHLHPAGLVSSAFYLAVPELAEGEADGYFELGRPPEDLQLELEPIRVIRPDPGKLVLFPSYLYHGTRPFSAGERLSVAFDAGLGDKG